MSQTNKTIFMTGTSTGLGRAAVKLFAAKGWKVWATMRTPEKEAELGAIPNVSLLALDVTKPEQIKDAARVALQAGPVDVLFNNAGYGLAGPLEGTSDAQIVREIDTNLLGVLRTTQAFLPAFRERRSGLVITTTSIGGHVAFPFNSVYHATKWALEGWSESVSHELARFGIGVKTVAPGGIKTDFISRSLVMAEHAAYAEHVGKVLGYFTSPDHAAQSSTSEQIADVVYEAATDGKDQLRYIAGADANALFAQRQAAGGEAFRLGMRQLLG